MAEAFYNQDPLQELITNGRLRTVPYLINHEVTVLDVNLDQLFTSLRSVVRDVYGGWDLVGNYYSGTLAERTQAINDDLDHMLILLLWCCYNRLRAVAERYAPHIRSARMNTRAPCSARLEFPSHLARLVQTIGPLRITEAAVDTMILYAPPTGTPQNYGRAAPNNPLPMRHERIMGTLRNIGVTMAEVDMTPTFGSFWTTCRAQGNGGLIDIVGTCHPSHYVNEHVAFAIIMAATANGTDVFPHSTTFTAGVIEDAATTTAVGMNPHFTCFLARHLNAYETHSVWMHRLRQ